MIAFKNHSTAKIRELLIEKMLTFKIEYNYKNTCSDSLNLPNVPPADLSEVDPESLKECELSNLEYRANRRTILYRIFNLTTLEIKDNGFVNFPKGSNMINLAVEVQLMYEEY